MAWNGRYRLQSICIRTWPRDSNSLLARRPPERDVNGCIKPPAIKHERTSRQPERPVYKPRDYSAFITASALRLLHLFIEHRELLIRFTSFLSHRDNQCFSQRKQNPVALASCSFRQVYLRITRKLKQSASSTFSKELFCPIFAVLVQLVSHWQLCWAVLLAQYFAIKLFEVKEREALVSIAIAYLHCNWSRGNNAIFAIALGLESGLRLIAWLASSRATTAACYVPTRTPVHLKHSAGNGSDSAFRARV